MEPSKALVFDISGRYAHYKKIYVTTSALSNVIPFKTSIYGLVGAIMGLQRNDNEYLNKFSEEKCKIGIQILNAINSQRLNINLSEAPGPIKNSRKPTLVEYVLNPKYRIFFCHSDEVLLSKLKNRVETGRFHYTPVLGLAHCIANVDYDGFYDIERFSGTAAIHSIVDKKQFLGFDEENWKDENIHIEEQAMYALEMSTSREVTKRTTVLYERNAKPIVCDTNTFYSVQNEAQPNIMLL